MRRGKKFNWLAYIIIGSIIFFSGLFLFFKDAIFLNPKYIENYKNFEGSPLSNYMSVDGFSGQSSGQHSDPSAPTPPTSTPSTQPAPPSSQPSTCKTIKIICDDRFPDGMLYSDLTYPSCTLKGNTKMIKELKKYISGLIDCGREFDRDTFEAILRFAPSSTIQCGLLHEAIHLLTPQVDPCTDEMGAYRSEAKCLDNLYKSLNCAANQNSKICKDIQKEYFEAASFHNFFYCMCGETPRKKCSDCFYHLNELKQLIPGYPEEALIQACIMYCGKEIATPAQVNDYCNKLLKVKRPTTTTQPR